MKIKQTDWWTCDGGPRPSGISRRKLLGASGFQLASWTGLRSALADIAIARGGGNPSHDILVSIFLRGGADGLNAVVPYFEDAYYRNRPNLSVPPPKSGGAHLLDLDGKFGFHPSLNPLLPAFREGQLAIVHACGSQDGTRSHFEAMAAIERGLAYEGSGPTSGWIARHLASTQTPADSPLRAVAFGGTLPDSLRGASTAVALESLSDFRLDVGDDQQEHFHRILGELYKGEKDEVSHAGTETLAVLDSLKKIDPKQYRPSNGAKYPTSDLGQGLLQTSCLIRANLGLEIAALDRGGWDTHYAQGSTVGIFSLSLDDLAQSLAAFRQDMGQEMRRVTVVVMTEFGRRLSENAGLGTDHGRASFMMVLGGGAKGGKVYAQWPGLEASQLDETGDLRVTTDYRDVLGEVLQSRLRNNRLTEVFSGYSPKPLGITSAIPV